jgi:hypothetical protein
LELDAVSSRAPESRAARTRAFTLLEMHQMPANLDLYSDGI